MGFVKLYQSIAFFLIAAIMTVQVNSCTKDNSNNTYEVSKDTQIEVPVLTAANIPVEITTGVAIVIIEGINSNFDVEISKTNDFSYSYDKTKFAVNINKDESKDKDKYKGKCKCLNISVSNIENVTSTWKDRAKIYLPANLNFSRLKVISKNSGISICELNKPMYITNNQGSVTLNVPKNISNDINYSSIEGAGTVYINTNDTSIVNDVEEVGYTFILKQSSSAISLPTEFSNYTQSATDYQYVSGNGLAKIRFDLTSSALSVKLQ